MKRRISGLPTYRVAVAGLCAGALCTFAGCLEREETIVVDRDGGAELRVEFTGDPADFSSGDALPGPASGWKVSDSRKTVGGDGEAEREEQTRAGRMRVAAGAGLPDSYAAPSDPNHETALLFPTEVRVEKRRDGVYYHFRRTYLGRQFARYNYWQELVKSSGSFPDLPDGDPSELSDDQRAALVEGLARVEVLKMAEYVRSGVEAMGDAWPQHYGLLLRDAVLASYEQTDIAAVARLLAQPESAERDAAINQFGERLTAQVDARVQDTLVHLGVSRQQIAAFNAAYSTERARHAVTVDLGDETWKVRVKLPGELVAHNGTGTEDGYVVWEFTGDALMDRDQDVFVTSRLTRGGGGGERGE